jgi:D-3-phosphoglycerate dehydrogenase
MTKVLILSNINRAFPGFAEARATLDAAGVDVTDPGGRFVPPEEVADLIADAEGVLIGGTHPLRAPALRAATRLRVVIREGIGVDNIDVDEATALGIVVGNTAGSNADSVADHTFAVLLTLVRDLYRIDREMRAGRGWEHRPPLGQIAGRTIGVLGTGNVGRGVVRRAAGFGMTVLGHDIAPDPTLPERYGLRYVDLATLLASSDVLTLHVPLTPLTRGLIDAAAIRAMPSGSLLINTARGEILDLVALRSALLDGHLAGAAIDAWPDEPVTSSDLFELPNVVVTPHVGGNSTQSSINARTWGARNLLAAFEGRPRDVVNPEVLEAPALRLAVASLG